MKVLKKEKGITLIALIITVIVLIIITSVSIKIGKDLLYTANLESIETNMLTIKAKAKAYIENVESKNWTSKSNNKDENYGGLSTKEGQNRAELQGDKYKLTLLENVNNYYNAFIWNKEGYTYYILEEKALEQMGLKEIWNENEVYMIRFPLEDGNTEGLDIDVIYPKGMKYKGVVYCELSEIQKVL